MNQKHSFSLILMFFCTLSLAAQQMRSYAPDTVLAKTRSKDQAGNPVYSQWKPFETRLVDSLFHFTPESHPVFSKYGGNLEEKYTATGFFYTKKVDDRWWVIDPEGYRTLHVAMNSLTPGKSERNQASLKAKYKNKANWSLKTGGLLNELNFNGTGSWSDLESVLLYNKTATRPLAYTLNLNFMSVYGNKRGGTYQVPGHKAYPGNAIFVFDPAFEKFCDAYAKRLLAYKDDPNLFGYFSDNELPLSLKNLEGYLNLENKKDPGYLIAKKWLDNRGITPAQITDKDRSDFLAVVGERYFSIVAKAIKKYDPNHLYIGCRFYSGEKNVPAFMKAAGKYLDIVSINYYGVWTPDQDKMNEWARWTGKPFIITEFYTKGEDAGLGNISGAGWRVKTQTDRGKAYQNFCLALLENKNCVGWHWFKYQDNDPTLKGAEPSNTDANKGIVDYNYNLYQPLADKMNQLNQNRYKLISYFDQEESKNPGVVANTYYIDSRSGDDNHNGLSPKTAWQTLEKVNTVFLSPGSKLLFRAGGRWAGSLKPLGSGSAGAPIIIDSYAAGPRPLLDGKGITQSGVITLFNQSYFEINNLEIINTADTDAERRGIEINGSNYGLIRHIYLKNLLIHHIRGTVGNSMSDKRSAGIYITVSDDREVPTRYDDVLIEGCEIYHCQNQGIAISNEITVADDPGSSAWKKRRMTNLRIRNNIIHHISKNAMIIRLADKGIIERNRCYETALGTTGNTIFSRSALNTVFQYNEGFLNRSPDYDGSMYDPDLQSPGTIWQYSYSHDNAHGLVWFCTVPSDTGVIVRYNVSKNDKGNLVYLNYGFRDASIYNNTFYIGSGLNPKVIVENPKNDHSYTYENNMVYAENAQPLKFAFAASGMGKGIQQRTIKNNIFYTAAKLPAEIQLSDNLNTDPLLAISGKKGYYHYNVPNYKLLHGSPALGAGAIIPPLRSEDNAKRSNIGFYNGPAVTRPRLAGKLTGETGLPIKSAVKNKGKQLLQQLDPREIQREMSRYRALVYTKQDWKIADSAKLDRALRDTAIFVLKRQAAQKALLIKRKLWPFKNYADLLSEMKAVNRRRLTKFEKKEVLFGPVQFTPTSFYDYQFSNAVTTLKEMMTGKELPVNDQLLKSFYKNLKQTTYMAEKYTFKKMHRQVKAAYIEYQYALLIEKMAADL